MKCYLCKQYFNFLPRKFKGGRVCWDCYHTKCFTCSKCSKVYLKTDLGHVGAQNADYCKKCMGVKGKFKIRQPYNFIPETFHFYKLEKEDSPLYLGFELELEVQKKYSVIEVIKKINNFIKRNKIFDYFYFKGDGSLCKGIEIVSFPATIGFINDYFLLNKFLTFLNKYTKISLRCGFHAHIPKETLTNKQLSALQYFAHINREELFNLSGRSKTLITQRRKREGFSTNKEALINIQYFRFTERTKTDVIKGNCNNFKFIAIAERKNTIEFRFFGGSLNPEVIKNKLKIIQGLISYVKEVNPLVIADYPEFKHFKKFLDKKDEYIDIKPIIKKAGEKVLCGAHLL